MTTSAGSSVAKRASVSTDADQRASAPLGPISARTPPSTSSSPSSSSSSSSSSPSSFTFSTSSACCAPTMHQMNAIDELHHHHHLHNTHHHHQQQQQHHHQQQSQYQSKQSEGQASEQVASQLLATGGNCSSGSNSSCSSRSSCQPSTQVQHGKQVDKTAPNSISSASSSSSSSSSSSVSSSLSSSSSIGHTRAMQANHHLDNVRLVTATASASATAAATASTATTTASTKTTNTTSTSAKLATTTTTSSAPANKNQLEPAAGLVAQPVAKRRGRRRQQAIPEQPNGLDRVFVWDIDGSLMRAGIIADPRKVTSSEPSVLASVADQLSGLSKRLKQMTLTFCEQQLYLSELELADQMHIDDVPSDHSNNQMLDHNNNNNATGTIKHQKITEDGNNNVNCITEGLKEASTVATPTNAIKPEKSATYSLPTTNGQSSSKRLAKSASSRKSEEASGEQLERVRTCEATANLPQRGHQGHQLETQQSHAAVQPNQHRNHDNQHQTEARAASYEQLEPVAPVHQQAYSAELPAGFGSYQSENQAHQHAPHANYHYPHVPFHHHPHQQQHVVDHYYYPTALQQQQQHDSTTTMTLMSEGPNQMNNLHGEQQMHQANYTHDEAFETNQFLAQQHEQAPHSIANMCANYTRNSLQQIGNNGRNNISNNNNNDEDSHRIQGTNVTNSLDDHNHHHHHAHHVHHPPPQQQQQQQQQSFQQSSRSSSVTTNYLFETTDSGSMDDKCSPRAQAYQRHNQPARVRRLSARLALVQTADNPPSDPAQAANEACLVAGHVQTASELSGFVEQAGQPQSLETLASFGEPYTGLTPSGTPSEALDTCGGGHQVASYHQLTNAADMLVHEPVAGTMEGLYDAATGLSHSALETPLWSSQPQHAPHQAYQGGQHLNHYHAHQTLSHLHHQPNQPLGQTLQNHLHDLSQTHQTNHHQHNQHHHHHHHPQHHHHHLQHHQHQMASRHVHMSIPNDSQYQQHINQIHHASQHLVAMQPLEQTNHHQHHHHHQSLYNHGQQACNHHYGHQQEPGPTLYDFDHAEDIQIEQQPYRHKHQQSSPLIQQQQQQPHHHHHLNHQQQQQQLASQDHQHTYGQGNSRLHNHDEHIDQHMQHHHHQLSLELMDSQQNHQQQTTTTLATSGGVLTASDTYMQQVSLERDTVREYDGQQQAPTVTDNKRTTRNSSVISQNQGRALENNSTSGVSTNTSLRTYVSSHPKQQSQKLSVRFHRLKTIYSQYRGNIPHLATSSGQLLSAIENQKIDAKGDSCNKSNNKVHPVGESLIDILDEIDHYTLDWRKHAVDCLKLISESQNCTNIIITRMPLVIALGHLICLGFSHFFDIDQIYSSSKTSKEACIKRVKKRFGAANRCSYIIVGDKEDSDMAKKLDLPCWTTSRSDGHRQLIQLYTALKEGYLM